MLYQIDYPDGSTVEKAYTDRGQLYTTKFEAAPADTLYTEDTRTYDVGGRLSTSAYRNGVTTTYAYRSSGGSKDNQLSTISYSHPARTVPDLHDPHLHLGCQQEQDQGDDLQRLSGGSMHNYSFDTTLGGRSRRL